MKKYEKNVQNRRVDLICKDQEKNMLLLANQKNETDSETTRRVVDTVLQQIKSRYQQTLQRERGRLSIYLKQLTVYLKTMQIFRFSFIEQV